MLKCRHYEVSGRVCQKAIGGALQCEHVQSGLSCKHVKNAYRKYHERKQQHRDHSHDSVTSTVASTKVPWGKVRDFQDPAVGQHGCSMMLEVRLMGRVRLTGHSSFRSIWLTAHPVDDNKLSLGSGEPTYYPPRSVKYRANSYAARGSLGHSVLIFSRNVSSSLG
jgi:hypothetical protein